jgi:hypothetical protein
MKAAAVPVVMTINSESSVAPNSTALELNLVIQIILDS